MGDFDMVTLSALFSWTGPNFSDKECLVIIRVPHKVSTKRKQLH